MKRSTVIETYREKGEWMIKPVVGNCIQGLEHLTQLDSLLVQRLSNWIEILGTIDQKNKYLVKNMNGQSVYYAIEESSQCLKCCCGTKRPSSIIVYDKSDSAVIKILHPYQNNCFKISCICCKCCRNQLQITTGSDQVLGYIKEIDNCGFIVYFILDENKSLALILKGPHYYRCCCSADDFSFKIMDKTDRVEIGTITNLWRSWTQEWLSNSENYGFQIPIDLAVNIKALILAATFFIVSYFTTILV